MIVPKGSAVNELGQNAEIAQKPLDVRTVLTVRSRIESSPASVRSPEGRTRRGPQFSGVVAVEHATGVSDFRGRPWGAISGAGRSTSRHAVLESTVESAAAKMTDP